MSDVDVVQFAFSIEKDSGREKIIKYFNKSFEAPLKVLSSEGLGDSRNSLLSGAEEFREYKREVSNIDLSYDFSQHDYVLAHNALATLVFEDVDVEVVLMNHGASKEHTYNYSSWKEVCGEVDDVEEIREEISKVYRKAELVLANSGFVRMALKNYLGVDSVLLSDPVDCGFYRPDNSENEGFFLSVQRLEWFKRPVQQLEMFSSIDESIKVVGSGSMEPEVESFAEKNDNIEFVGEVSSEELRSLYNRAEALVHTGIPEDASNVIKEAQACGTPVVAFDHGANREICAYRELLSQDFDEMAKILQSFESSDYSSSLCRRTSLEDDLELQVLTLKKLLET